MTILSDVKIIDMIMNKKLVVSPFVLENIQPSSVDLTLDSIIKIPQESGEVVISEDNSGFFEEYSIENDYELKPGAMILAQVGEDLKIPRDCNGQIHNRSSVARLGIDVGMGSYINPGYEGRLPLVIKNNGPLSVRLVPGMRICQLVLSTVDPEPQRDYSQRRDSKYFGELDSLVSRIHHDTELIEFKKKKEPDKESLASFLQKRIKEKGRKVVDGMSDDVKRELELLS